MSKNKLLQIFKNLLKIIIALLILELVWPDSDTENVAITSQMIMQLIHKLFFKYGIPYLIFEIYYLVKSNMSDSDQSIQSQVRDEL